MKNQHILVPGKNCWRLDKADSAAFLIDADAYFRAFREAVKLARRNIFICGWDIDSRLALIRGKPGDDHPVQLGSFLNEMVQSRKDLHIYILIWDFVRFMGIDREWFPQFKLGWESHRNIHFHLDNIHPVGASQHHKLVVIDDVLAFAGGLDLTKERWDTTGHRPDDWRRKNPEGEPYRPHHDIQMMVSGKPAHSLGIYFRERWKLATGGDIDGEHERVAAIWPQAMEVNVRGCPVGIARTRPQYKGLPKIEEVERLYLDSIEGATEYIYIENQYLTSTKITRALAQCLQKNDGPEVIIVLPYATDGWLSQYTMDILRSQAIKMLREADRRKKLGMYYAYQKGLEGDDTIKIHSKLMIIDDLFVRIGSSNLNNRSMGFDTECDLAMEGEAASEAEEAVRHLRNRLLGEHLGVAAADVEEAVRRNGSLLRAVEELRGNSRSLEVLDPGSPELLEFIAQEQELFDPERPIEPENFVRQWLPVEQMKEGRFRIIQMGMLVFILLGAAVAWRFSPLQEFISMNRLQDMVAFLKESELAWLYVISAYGVGSLLVVPITVLITLTVLVYGVVHGFLFSVLGSVVSCSITYWLGRILGRETVRSFAGNKLTALSKKLGHRGILSTFIIRLMPVAPYSVVNVVAGASHIRFTDFIIGTILGLVPGILAIAGIIDRGFAMLRSPDVTTVLSAVGVFAVVVPAFYFLQKKFREK